LIFTATVHDASLEIPHSWVPQAAYGGCEAVTRGSSGSQTSGFCETGTPQEPFDGTGDMQYISATLNKARSCEMPAVEEATVIRHPLTNF